MTTNPSSRQDRPHDAGVPAAPSGHSAEPEPISVVSAETASVPNADYALLYLQEFARHIPSIDLKTALYLWETNYEQSQDGDPIEDARDEADEWRASS